MIRPDTRLRVYLCREPVDMRKQIDGLALLVQEAMELNPEVTPSIAAQVIVQQSGGRDE